MSLFKKILSLLSAAVISFSIIPSIGVSADSEDYSYSYTDGHRYAEAEQYIAEQLYNAEEKIDLSGFNITVDEFNEIITDILLNRPDIFYVDTQYYYTSYTNSKRIITVTPGYYYSKASVRRMREEMESAADKLLAGVSDSWSDVQKALYIHDKIVIGTKYNIDNNNRSAYEVLVNKNGLCVAYALAYKYLLNKAGIGCVCVISTDMEHCWNMAEIDGSWYHVDTTWDDLLPDFEGAVSHDLFLLSDSAITSSAIPHYNWDVRYKADSTAYDDMFWSASEAQIIPVTSNIWYYIDSFNGTLSRYNWSKGISGKLLDIDMNWKSGRSSTYRYCFSRLEYADSKLYYNNSDTILSYDISDKSENTEKSVSVSGTRGIYGLAVKDGKLVYETANSRLDYNPVTKTAFEVSSGGALEAPESFRGIASKSNGKYSVKLTWDNVKDADGYTVYRYDAIGKKAQKIADTEKTGYTVKNLSPGNYSYIVCAYKTINGKKIYGDFSSTVTKKLK